MILSGHRRWEAAKSLGWETIECIVRGPFQNRGDEEEYLIEANRYRQKTFLEVMAEAAKLEQIYSERSLARQKAGGTVPSEGTTAAKVAQLTGIGSDRQYQKMKTVLLAAASNPNLAAKLDKLEAGSTTIHALYTEVRELEAAKLKTSGDFVPKVYNVWNFDAPDPRFGQPHPGRIPGQIVENLLYYYTNIGDLVVDPFAGGGVTIDVCEHHGRQCLAYDLVPKRDDVQQWDITKGYPTENFPEGADFIFMDPPYWNQEAEGYSDESVSALSMEQFVTFIENLMVYTRVALKVGGHCALIITTQTHRLPESIDYIDWPFCVYYAGTHAGLTPIQRISKPWTTACYAPFQVDAAKRDKKMLGILGDILVFRRDR